MLRRLAKGSPVKGTRYFSVQQNVGSTEKVLSEDLSPHVKQFVLNSPKTLNALDMDMIHILWENLTKWHNEPKTAPTVLFIRGTGEKAFCAGGDIKSIYDGGVNEINPNVPKEFFAREYIVDYALTQMKPIQISVWNGICMGGGVGISVHSPIRIATEKTVFAMPETGIGFFTDVGGSYFLSRLKDNPSLGCYLGVTGHRLKAKDCLRWGVATNYVETSKLDQLYDAVVKYTKEDTTLEEVKKIVDEHSDHDMSADDIPEETISYCFKPDSIHNIHERLKQVSAGDKKELDQNLAKKWLSIIQKVSPVS